MYELVRYITKCGGPRQRGAQARPIPTAAQRAPQSLPDADLATTGDTSEEEIGAIAEQIAAAALLRGLSGARPFSGRGART